jgi:hypothetical protein
MRPALNKLLVKSQAMGWLCCLKKPLAEFHPVFGYFADSESTQPCKTSVVMVINLRLTYRSVRAALLPTQA